MSRKKARLPKLLFGTFVGKGGDISEDEIKDLEDQVQKLTDKFIAEIDGAIAEKTKEIMTV